MSAKLGDDVCDCLFVVGRREPSPFSLGALGDIAGTLESLLSSLVGGGGEQRRDDVS